MEQSPSYPGVLFNEVIRKGAGATYTLKGREKGLTARFFSFLCMAIHDSNKNQKQK